MRQELANHRKSVDLARPGVRDFFRHRGILAHHHPDYEFRPGQLSMAEEIEAALFDRRHLTVEAGTGTGKTLAYLVPILNSGKRVIISTGTKALQEQLYRKDIPFLEKVLGKSLEVAYMKGRNNYLCRQKLYDTAKHPFLENLTSTEDFKTIQTWERKTQIGDRAELKQLPEKNTIWSKLDARKELCSGQKCEQFDRCFLTLMQRKARKSDIIIVNHHLFFADLSLRDNEFASIIPDYQAVILDEAHDIEEIAGKYFGVDVSNYRFEELAHDIHAVSIQGDFGSKKIEQTIENFRFHFQNFFKLFDDRQDRSEFDNRDKFHNLHQKPYAALLTSLENLGNELELVRQKIDELIPLNRRVKELDHDLRFLVEGDDRRFVYWVEKRSRAIFLKATPIDISEILKEHLFDKIDTAILTSATLAVEGKFDFSRRRLGLDSARELVVPNHFNFPEQVLFYIPPNLPNPRTSEFVKAAADEIIRVLRLSRGRAFVLFTSYQQMQAVHDFVSFAIEYPTLIQGSAPNSSLLDQFRLKPNCILFATASFWQGVDVPGEQLSCVIIDKLPFSVPTEPVTQARIKAIRISGGNPFYEYQIPQAVISLKQGFGRLIRGTQDRGTLVLLDTRVLEQSYGRIFLNSLPDYTFTTSPRDVEKFFQAE